MEEQTQQAEAPVEAPVEQTAQEVVRPEWLPEKFQTPEELAKSYGELSTKIGQKEDDIKEQVMKQLEEEAYSGRPESAGDYQIPDVLNEEEAATNPLLKEWAEYAWENGYSQEEFSHWVSKFAEYQTAQQPDLDSVKTELGDNANARVEAIQLWMNKFFPDQEMQEAVAELGASVGGIKALEKVIEATKGTSLNTNTVTTGQLSQADIEAKMKDPRYWQQGKRDEAFVQEVNNDWKRLLNTG
jgi:uncharacterized protein YqeY